MDGRAYASGSDYTLLTAAFNVQALLFLLAVRGPDGRRLAPVRRRLRPVLRREHPDPAQLAERGGWPLLSLPRFGVTIFPLFLALASLGQRQRVHSAIVAVSAAGLGLVTVQWALWQWMG